MPELPEVEVVRRGLAHHCVGSRIADVRVLDARSLRRFAPGVSEFLRQLEGLMIVDCARRGKYMWLVLADEMGNLLDDALVIHLGMSGQVLLKDAAMPVEKHLKIVMELYRKDQKPLQLRFVDQRIFGGMFLDQLVPTLGEGGEPVPAASSSKLGLSLIPRSVAHIARDPLDSLFDIKLLRKKLLKTSSGIKRLLLDQSVISGVGNIYADEALWRAKLHYAKPARSLSLTQTKELVNAAQDVMHTALDAGGTSFDALYVNVNGESGYFDRSLNAYGQAGKPCSRCLDNGKSSLIVREPFMNRSSYRCPVCQKTPKFSHR
ncbi:bifunctional DNA-formamidopyrimidine glycosylase/DNA-(apurinic or apyrimidinic site) lyase [uncultured Rothia sp.]|uniref:bifunctional DNA-formamidopyrimidine glycosylase/DNA-(apurinic or apyrimidinic site) lyase n=1 Tax=uncultured Rothia sp. TaxID=316088 RepID=UPI00321659BA